MKCREGFTGKAGIPSTLVVLAAHFVFPPNGVFVRRYSQDIIAARDQHGQAMSAIG